MTRLASLTGVLSLVIAVGCTLESIDPEISGVTDHPFDLPDIDPTLRIDPGFIDALCDRPGVFFDAFIGAERAIDCTWLFDDGGTFSGCRGTYEFATSGFHSIQVIGRDPVTGLYAGLETARFIEPAVFAELSVTAPACGLTFSWTSRVNISSSAIVRIRPAGTLGADQFFEGNGSITVATGGVYEVVLLAEDQRNPLPTCTAEAIELVTVTACEGPPECKDAH